MPIMRKFNTKAMKVSTARVKEMYDRLQSGELTQGQAAAIYGLGVIQVGRIARGESRAQETGANENPVPNFNVQISMNEVEASAQRMKDRLGQQVANAPTASTDKSVSWYDLPPPEVPGEPTGEGMAKFQQTLDKMTENLPKDKDFDELMSDD